MRQMEMKKKYAWPANSLSIYGIFYSNEKIKVCDLLHKEKRQWEYLSQQNRWRMVFFSFIMKTRENARKEELTKCIWVIVKNSKNTDFKLKTSITFC